MFGYKVLTVSFYSMVHCMDRWIFICIRNPTIRDTGLRLGSELSKEGTDGEKVDLAFFSLNFCTG